MSNQNNIHPNKKVVIGIVVYNTPISDLDQALISCHKSDCDPVVVVLCNSPRAEYQKKVIDLCEKHEVKCMSHEPNRGFGAGHNTIVKSSFAEWYVCCNPDIVMEPDAVSKLIGYGEIKGDDAFMIMPKVIHQDGRVQPLARKHLTPYRWIHRQLWRIFPNLFCPQEISFNYLQSQPVEFVTGCFFCIRYKHYLALGGFDEAFFLYAEDADLSYRADLIGTNYYYADALVRHGWSTKWGKNWLAVILELKSLTRFFNKHRLWLPNFQSFRH